MTAVPGTALALERIGEAEVRRGAGEAGGALWAGVRALRGWGAGRAERGSPPPPLGGDADVWAALAVLSRAGEEAGGADEGRLLHAARTAAAWAESRGAWGAALALAEAAAVAFPGAPSPAIQAAGLALRRREEEAAVAWLRAAAARLGRAAPRQQPLRSSRSISFHSVPTRS